MSSRASVADATSITGTTGPNVSSLAITISGVTPSMTVASAYKEVGKSVDRPSATADPGPGRNGLAYVAVELFRRRLVIERAHSGGGVEGVAEPHALGRRRHHALHEFPPDSRWTRKRSPAVQLWPAQR